MPVFIVFYPGQDIVRWTKQWGGGMVFDGRDGVRHGGIGEYPTVGIRQEDPVRAMHVLNSDR